MAQKHPSTTRNMLWVKLGVPALTVLLGMQTLRGILSYLIYVLRDRLGWGVEQVGLTALLVFASGFLAGLLARWLGARWALILTIACVGLFRLGTQLWTGDPLIDLYLVTVGTVAFIIFFPLYLGYARRKGGSVLLPFASGILLGLALEMALHGAYSTYGMIWRSDLGTAALVAATVLLQWVLLSRLASEPDLALSDFPWRLALTWLAWGPLLYLQLIIFTNIARLGSLTGWPLPLAYAWAVLAHAVGMAAALILIPRLAHQLFRGVALFGMLLVLCLLPTWPQGLWAAVLLLVGQICNACLLVFLLSSYNPLNPEERGNNLSHISVTHGLSMILLVVFSFMYFAATEIPLLVAIPVLPPAAGLVVAAAVLTATRLRILQDPPIRATWTPVYLAFALLALPLIQALTWSEPQATAGDGGPVRVMTYNLHAGFDPFGHQGMQALATTIAAQDPDIVALQEVVHGWVVDGSIDMATWLSQRLDMPYVYSPTANPLWGNVILSRYPILEYEAVNLPPRDISFPRSFVWALIDIGDGSSLNVINTHFHHPEDASQVRQVHTQAILDYWGGRQDTLILGDLNAEPGSPEIEKIRTSGFSDVLELNDVQPRVTWPSLEPYQSLDYIWISPELYSSQAVVPLAYGSDHLPVAATIWINP